MNRLLIGLIKLMAWSQHVCSRCREDTAIRYLVHLIKIIYQDFLHQSSLLVSWPFPNLFGVVPTCFLLRCFSIICHLMTTPLLDIYHLSQSTILRFLTFIYYYNHFLTSTISINYRFQRPSLRIRLHHRWRRVRWKCASFSSKRGSERIGTAHRGRPRRVAADWRADPGTCAPTNWLCVALRHGVSARSLHR